MKRSAPSLRKRYISLTLILGLVIISIVAFFYRDVITTQYEVSLAYEGINEEQQKLENIRSNLHKIYRNIDFFLLDPLHSNFLKNIETLTANTVVTINELNDSDHHFHIGLESKTALLQSQLEKLKQQIDYLFEVRMDVNRQYPGLGLSANEMSEPQNAVQSDLRLMIEEIESGEYEPASDETYPLLLKTYTLWISGISQLRIYLSNRFASFSTGILVDQANSLSGIHEKFESSIDRVEQLYLNEDSFVASTVIENIKKNSSMWHGYFLQVRKMIEADDWRTDSHIMRSKIIPLVDKTVVLIQGIDNILLLEQGNISERLRLSNDTLSTLIFAVIALFLLFIISIIVSMEWMIFKPINSVTLALRSKAFNIDLPQLEGARSHEVGSLIEAFQEMDDEVTQRQNALEHQALHDHLTGLPNRFMIHQRIEYQLLSAERSDEQFTLLLMDLDHFKDINDTLGHSAGDMLLIEVSQRLTGLMRKSDTVARLGGDEFAVLLPETDRKNSEKIADSIAESLGRPYMLNGQKVGVAISIGIVNYPDDGKDAMTLLQHADMAMYVAKRKRTGFSHYEENQDFYSTERLVLINDLHNALEQDSFELYFQPKIDVESESLTGAEALLRWDHKKYGFIAPDKIVELAEHVGVIHQLSFWVLDRAIQQCGQWHQLGRKLSIAVNLSVRDLANYELCDQIGILLDKYQLNSKYLILEITESVMMDNLALSLEVLNKLSRMGVDISIDDFGTGFSSLAYLKRLPVNELKIDKSFIIDMETDESDEVIVQSTINLGHNLGLRVVAEGIENRIVMDMVKRLGCDHVQGYYFGRPQNSQEFIRLLE